MTRPNALLLLLLAVAIPMSLLAGRVWLDPWTTPNAALILGELRLPRALLAVTIGAGLGAAGAAMQGYLRNPLADPGLFGIAPGAALGAVLSLFFGFTAIWALPGFALIGAGGAMALLGMIAGREGGVALFTLAGMMIERFGRIPHVGERLDWAGWRFEVVDLDGARIDKLLLHRLPDADDEDLVA